MGCLCEGGGTDVLVLFFMRASYSDCMAACLWGLLGLVCVNLVQGELGEVWGWSLGWMMPSLALVCIEWEFRGWNLGEGMSDFVVMAIEGEVMAAVGGNDRCWMRYGIGCCSGDRCSV